MGSTLVIAGLIPILGGIGIAALIILELRQQAALRRAGVNADNPGCAKCLYIMRGWDSSICPECGVDVRTAGARVGVHHSRFLKCLVALVSSSILTAIILWLVCSWLFAVQVDYGTTSYVAHGQGLPAFQIQIRSQRETRRFSEHTRAEATLIIDPNQTLDSILISTTVSSGAPFAGQRLMPLPEYADWNSRYGLYIAVDEEPPTEQTVLDLVNETLELDAAQALVVAKEMHMLFVSEHTGAPSNLFTPTIFASNMSGSGQFEAIWWPGQVIMWLGTIMTALTFVIWVFRGHRPGIRPIDEGEWARTATDTLAEPA